MESHKKTIFSSIIVLVVVILIGLNFWFSDKTPAKQINQTDIGLGGKTEAKIRSIDQTDHLLGKIDAPVKLIVYSDLECPFCKFFHFVLMRLYKEFGGEKVAIIYRHLPLDNLHSKSRNEAMATECAAEIGGSEKFWQYLDQIFNNTPSNDKLDPSLLSVFAQNIGLNVSAFKSCLSSNKYADKIAKAVTEASQAKIAGTPYPVLIDSQGKQTALGGYIDYEKLKPIIEEALK